MSPKRSSIPSIRLAHRQWWCQSVLNRSPGQVPSACASKAAVGVTAVTRPNVGKLPHSPYQATDRPQCSRPGHAEEPLLVRDKVAGRTARAAVHDHLQRLHMGDLAEDDHSLGIEGARENLASQPPRPCHSPSPLMTLPPSALPYSAEQYRASPARGGLPARRYLRAACEARPSELPAAVLLPWAAGRPPGSWHREGRPSAGRGRPSRSRAETEVPEATGGAYLRREV